MGILNLERVTLEIQGKRVLDDLSIDVWEGHVHALCGPNGAGKSTLANTVMGLSGYTDHTGDIVFEGESLRGISVHERARRGITLAWQEPARFEGLTVGAFIGAGLRNGNRLRVAEALEMVDLSPDQYLNRAVDRTLSGGERKRIELASIVAMRPKLVLMDEPDSGIDVVALDRILDCIAQLKERGTTILMITHSPVVLKKAEHAFLMCNGKLIDKGSIEKIDRYFEGHCVPCDHVNQPTEDAAS